MRRQPPIARRALPLPGLLLGAVLAAACAPADEGSPAPADGGSAITAYEGARLISGGDGAPVEDAVLLVQDGRIIEVGARIAVTVPDGATRVDLTGKTVMPALVNTHVHVPSERADLVELLEHMAYYGVGAAVSLGSDAGDAALQVRNETIAGAARLRSAGRGITRPEPGRGEVPYWVDTPEQARQAVQEQAARDIDIVKIWVDDRNGQYEKMTPELYGAVIDEAHRNDLRVTAHIFTLEDAKGLLEAGVDAFAHGIRDQDIDDELVSLWMAGDDVVLVPNLPDRAVPTDLGWLSGTVPAAQIELMQDQMTLDRPGAADAFAIQARNLTRLHEEGARVAFGTDGSVPWAAHVELEDMVAAGLTPAQVIVAATRTSAEFMEFDDLGVLESGRSADFIVLDANPLEDITNTRRISAVYLRGAAVDREGFSARRGEAAAN